jgi:hypothetical protein
MRINIVTGATYSPVRIAQNPKVNPEQKISGEPQIKTPAKGVDSLMDGLTPQEMGALQKLFGNFKQSKDASKNATPGQFIDITV